MRQFAYALAIGLMAWSAVALGESRAPWGSATAAEVAYEAQKVVYDLTSGDAEDVRSLLDRAAYLYEVTGSDPFDASIVIVVHGDAVASFAIEAFNEHEALMMRARSLTVGAPIEFRLCQAAARRQGFEPDDLHGFVRMVPMADAEIVRLQKQGYAYLR